MRITNIDKIELRTQSESERKRKEAIWNELFVRLDLCQQRYWSTLTSSSSSLFLRCPLFMRRACKRAFSHDLASLLSLSSSSLDGESARPDTLHWGRASVNIDFIWFEKRRTRWTRESIHLRLPIDTFKLPRSASSPGRYKVNERSNFDCLLRFQYVDFFSESNNVILSPPPPSTSLMKPNTFLRESQRTSLIGFSKRRTCRTWRLEAFFRCDSIT